MNDFAAGNRAANVAFGCKPQVATSVSAQVRSSLSQIGLRAGALPSFPDEQVNNTQKMG